MRRIYAVGVLEYDHCGGRMQIFAAVQIGQRGQLSDNRRGAQKELV
jgi:hypothetical protein